MNTETTTEALLRKIRALRAKAEDPSVTEAEAAAYAAKVAELLQKHNLSEASLEIDEKDEEGVVRETWEGDYLTDSWRRLICNAVAALYFCKGFGEDLGTHRTARKRRVQHFVGKPHNIIVAREMSEYLINTTLRLGKTWQRDNHGTHASFVNFIRACGYRLTERVQELHKAQTAAAPQRAANGNPSNLPALYADENTLIAQFLKSEGVSLHNVGSRQDAVGAGALAGRRAGDTISLSTQIQGGKSAGRLLR